MKILKVIVDEYPTSCDICPLRADYSDADMYCAGLAAKDYKAYIPYDMRDFRRSDCPLEVKNS